MTVTATKTTQTVTTVKTSGSPSPPIPTKPTTSGVERTPLVTSSKTTKVVTTVVTETTAQPPSGETTPEYCILEDGMKDPQLLPDDSIQVSQLDPSSSPEDIRPEGKSAIIPVDTANPPYIQLDLTPNGEDPVVVGRVVVTGNVGRVAIEKRDNPTEEFTNPSGTDSFEVPENGEIQLPKDFTASDIRITLLEPKQEEAVQTPVENYEVELEVFCCYERKAPIPTTTDSGVLAPSWSTTGLIVTEATPQPPSGETTPEYCTLEDGMKDPQLLPDDSIQVSQLDPSSSPQDIRPEGKSAIIPVDTANPPYIQLDLTPNDEDPVVVGRVVVTGNVGRVAIEKRDTPTEEFTNPSGRDSFEVPENGEIQLPKDFTASDIRITLLEPKQEETGQTPVENYEVELEVFCCYEPRVTTSAMVIPPTTPIGQTTPAAEKTTKVTTSETTTVVTTVVTEATTQPPSGETTPEYCTLEDGMKDPQRLPDGSIQVSQLDPSSSPQDIRPEGKSAIIPVDTANPPYIQLDLTPNGEDPVVVGRVVVTGNVGRVVIEKRDNPTEEFTNPSGTDSYEVPENGEIQLPKDFTASDIRITLLEPKQEEAVQTPVENYEVELEVFCCYEPKVTTTKTTQTVTTVKTSGSPSPPISTRPTTSAVEKTPLVTSSETSTVVTKVITEATTQPPSGETTPEYCTLEDGMKDPQRLPDNSIQVSQLDPSSSPKDIRPEGKSAIIPVDTANPPYIQLDLTPNGEDPVVVGRVVVTGNVGRVAIEKRDNPTEEFTNPSGTDSYEVPENGEIRLPKDFTASDIRITLLEPKQEEAGQTPVENYEVELEVFCCYEPKVTTTTMTKTVTTTVSPPPSGEESTPFVQITTVITTVSPSGEETTTTTTVTGPPATTVALTTGGQTERPLPTTSVPTTPGQTPFETEGPTAVPTTSAPTTPGQTTRPTPVQTEGPTPVQTHGPTPVPTTSAPTTPVQTEGPTPVPTTTSPTPTTTKTDVSAPSWSTTGSIVSEEPTQPPSGETTPEYCTMEDGMKDPQLLPDDSIQVSQLDPSSSPQDIRPEGKSAIIPVDTANPPYIQLDLTPNGEDPVVVGRVIVTGNVGRVAIEKRNDPTEEFANPSGRQSYEVPENGEIQLPKDFTASDIRITLLEPKQEEVSQTPAENYEVELEVFCCYERKGMQTEGPTPVQTEGPTPVPTTAAPTTRQLTPVQTVRPTLVQTEGPTPVQTEGPTPVPTTAAPTTAVQTEGPTPVETEGPTPVQTEGPTSVQTTGPTSVPTTATPTTAEQNEEPTPVPSTAPPSTTGQTPEGRTGQPVTTPVTTGGSTAVPTTKAQNISTTTDSGVLAPSWSTAGSNFTEETTQETTPEYCTMEDGMKDPQLLPDDSIQVSQLDPSSSPQDIRPEGKSAIIPVDTANPPYIQLDLTPNGEDPVVVGRVVVTGNVGRVTIEKRNNPTEEFTSPPGIDSYEVPENGEIQLPKDFTASDIRITLLEPKQEETGQTPVENYEVELEGCRLRDQHLYRLRDPHLCQRLLLLQLQNQHLCRLQNQHLCRLRGPTPVRTAKPPVTTSQQTEGPTPAGTTAVVLTPKQTTSPAVSTTVHVTPPPGSSVPTSPVPVSSPAGPREQSTPVRTTAATLATTEQDLEITTRVAMTTKGTRSTAIPSVTTTSNPNVSGTTAESLTTPEYCTLEDGMKDPELLPDGSIQVSQLDPSSSPQDIRPEGKSAIIPVDTANPPYIQLDLTPNGEEPVVVGRVVVTGNVGRVAIEKRVKPTEEFAIHLEHNLMKSQKMVKSNCPRTSPLQTSESHFWNRNRKKLVRLQQRIMKWNWKCFAVMSVKFL
ncbi:mucin-2-like [Liolophura sinensis]|uniref:mucin-2-like n=1 Tax=Liolophura sinensis TaxID=3198878 RepID=UPI0031583F7C